MEKSEGKVVKDLRGNNMKIAQISPATITTPPSEYGGTQRVVYMLTNELVKRGHEVTLFAKKGFYCDAKTIYYGHILELLPKLSNFDLIHNHVNRFYWPPLLSNFGCSSLTTQHWWIKYPWLIKINRLFGINYCVLNKRHENRFREAGIKNIWCIYNCVEPNTFREKKEDYLLYIGRIKKDKGIHKIVKVAKEVNRRLLIGGIVSEKTYFDEFIKPHIDNEKIKYLGVVDEKEKDALMSKAYCVLHAAEDEPFGLCIVEASIRGTPVIALNKGSMSEVVKEGYSGFLCASVEEMIERVEQISKIEPKNCKKWAENFSVEAMASSYEKVYKKITEMHS